MAAAEDITRPGRAPARPGRRGGGKAWDTTLSNWRALLLLLPLLLLLAGFVFYPLVKLTIDSLTTEGGLSNYGDAFDSAAIRKALITTMVAGVVVTVLAVGVGGVIAWYLRTVTNRFAQAVLWLAVLAPFWMGTVTKNYALILLFNKQGLLNDVLGILGFEPVSILYTPGAVVFGITYTMIPYAVFSLYAVFLSIDLSLVSAARSLGASRTTALRTVVIPLAVPGLVASSALVFAITIGFYVTPVLLGGASTPFMAGVIQENILSFFDYGIAAAASVLLLLVALIILGIALALVGRDRLVRAVA